MLKRHVDQLLPASSSSMYPSSSEVVDDIEPNIDHLISEAEESSPVEAESTVSSVVETEIVADASPNTQDEPRRSDRVRRPPSEWRSYFVFSDLYD